MLPEPLDRTSSARAICGAVRFLVMMISRTSVLVILLTGRSPHVAMNTEQIALGKRALRSSIRLAA
jgi:hypothetical protein